MALLPGTELMFCFAPRYWVDFVKEISFRLFAEELAVGWPSTFHIQYKAKRKKYLLNKLLSRRFLAKRSEIKRNTFNTNQKSNKRQNLFRFELKMFASSKKNSEISKAQVMLTFATFCLDMISFSYFLSSVIPVIVNNFLFLRFTLNVYIRFASIEEKFAGHPSWRYSAIQSLLFYLPGISDPPVLKPSPV